MKYVVKKSLLIIAFSVLFVTGGVFVATAAQTPPTENEECPGPGCPDPLKRSDNETLL